MLYNNYLLKNDKYRVNIKLKISKRGAFYKM